MVQSNGAQRTMGDVSYSRSGGVGGVGDCTRPLPTPKRPQGDLRATNRQDSTDPAVVVGPSISRTRKITFPAPSTYRSDLLGQSPMRAIGVGGLLRGETLSVRCCVLPCSAPSKRRARTDRSATHPALATRRQSSLPAIDKRRAASVNQPRCLVKQLLASHG